MAKKQNNPWAKELYIGGVKPVDIMLFTKHLAVTLKSGITLASGLALLTDQTKGKLKPIVKDVLRTVESGEKFSIALEKHRKYFSPLYINMVKYGESSGMLENSLHRLSVNLKKQHMLRKKIRSAMIYPTLVFVAIMGLGISIALFVLPKILPLFKTLDVELPLTTKILIAVAETFESHGFVLAIGTIVFIAAFMWLVRQDFAKPVTHRFILTFPLIKTIVRNINLENFTRTFGALLEAGLPITRSLTILGESTENRVYRKAILSLVSQIESGNKLRTGLEKYPKIFPSITSKMIDVGERTGNLENNLKYLGRFYEEEVNEATKNLATTIEPILLILIGIIVGTVAIAILGPIYEITGNLRN